MVALQQRKAGVGAWSPFGGNDHPPADVAASLLERSYGRSRHGPRRLAESQNPDAASRIQRGVPKPGGERRARRGGGNRGGVEVRKQVTGGRRRGSAQSLGLVKKFTKC
jgi:hypothetical protein